MCIILLPYSLLYCALHTIFDRGTRLQNADGTLPDPLTQLDQGEDIIDESTGPLRFRHDPRLVLASTTYHTKEQVLNYFTAIQAQTLLILAGTIL